DGVEASSHSRSSSPAQLYWGRAVYSIKSDQQNLLKGRTQVRRKAASSHVEAKTTAYQYLPRATPSCSAPPDMCSCSTMIRISVSRRRDHRLSIRDMA